MSEEGRKDLHRSPDVRDRAAERLRCIVPFCKCSTGKYAKPVEWICRKHWIQVPKYMRLRKGRIARKYRNEFGENPWHHFAKGTPRRRRAFRITVVYNQAWDACVRLARERAGGIS